MAAAQHSDSLLLQLQSTPSSLVLKDTPLPFSKTSLIYTVTCTSQPVVPADFHRASLTPFIPSPTLESEQHNVSSWLGMFGLASMLMYADGPELASNANNQAMSQHHYPPLLLRMHALTKGISTWSDLSRLPTDTLTFSPVWTDSPVGQRPFLSLLSLLRLLHRHLSMAGYQDSVRHQ